MALGTTVAGAYVYWNRSASDEAPPDLPFSQRAYGSPLQIQFFCSRCHAYPPAECLPRSAWKEEVKQAYQFFNDSNLAACFKHA